MDLGTACRQSASSRLSLAREFAPIQASVLEDFDGREETRPTKGSADEDRSSSRYLACRTLDNYAGLMVDESTRITRPGEAAGEGSSRRLAKPSTAAAGCCGSSRMWPSPCSTTEEPGGRLVGPPRRTEPSTADVGDCAARASTRQESRAGMHGRRWWSATLRRAGPRPRRPRPPQQRAGVEGAPGEIERSETERKRGGWREGARGGRELRAGQKQNAVRR
ncbi:hypothetical protein PVAP13_4KG331405 [Panicum virgatum]|uniref:Uncharacterized protein n=1 Tax=Panicum virgatum TaxID=38727 RepID=A0A8T0TM31_PANVG|nr:hypothetical protein PVAP13_4KG331405 [Panicum virgatum]